MRTLQRITSLFVSLLCTVPLYAKAPVPEDFAYGMQVETRGQASLWQIELPEDIYQSVTRADLGDLRVFDASDQIMPYILRLPAATKTAVSSPAELPFFPLYRGDDDNDQRQSLRIVTDDDGAVVNIFREPAWPETQDIITAYLLDATNITQRADKLVLAWEWSKNTGFSTTINVEASDDLSNWRRIVTNATLTDLRSGDHQLRQNEIELPLSDYKYLRISWPASLRDVELQQARVTFPTAELPLQRHWIQISGIQNPGSPISYDFDSNGSRPIDRARIVFSQQNLLINIELSSRPKETHAWSRRYHGLFYKLLKEDDAMLISPAISFDTTSDRYWHLKQTGGGNVFDQSIPVLELGWIPHMLTFVAQGQAPYLIAYGNASIEPQQQAIDPLLLSIQNGEPRVLIKTANTTQSFSLGGDDQLVPPAAPYPWRKLLLWLVLIAGTALLAWMTWRLSRDLSPPNAR